MLPLQLAGLALGTALLSKYRGAPEKSYTLKKTNNKRYTTPQFRLPGFKPPQLPPLPRFRLPELKLPQLPRLPQPPPLPKLPRLAVNDLFRNLSSSVSKLARTLTGDNYSDIVSPFIPAGARLLKPQFPSKSKAVLAADLDGDSREELVASYRHGGGIRTIVLKRLSEGWYKADEIDSPGTDTLKYRNAVNIAGDGKKQLLLGFPGKEKSVLHGYHLHKDTLNSMFAANFNRFELLGGEGANAKPRLAMWNKRDDGGYDIEMLGWNGLEMEHTGDTADYYLKSVVPYQARLVKSNPYSPSGWYGLADSLVKSGASRDAIIAVNAGMSVDTKSEYREKFTSLKNLLK